MNIIFIIAAALIGLILFGTAINMITENHCYKLYYKEGFKEGYNEGYFDAKANSSKIEFVN